MGNASQFPSLRYLGSSVGGGQRLLVHQLLRQAAMGRFQSFVIGSYRPEADTKLDFTALLIQC